GDVGSILTQLDFELSDTAVEHVDQTPEFGIGARHSKSNNDGCDSGAACDEVYPKPAQQRVRSYRFTGSHVPRLFAQPLLYRRRWSSRRRAEGEHRDGRLQFVHFRKANSALIFFKVTRVLCSLEIGRASCRERSNIRVGY